jgi:mannonate dehydratase
MKMSFRWYGEGNDTVTLDHIRQIPGVDTIVWSLHNKQAGEVWTEQEIADEIKKITALPGEDGYLETGLITTPKAVTKRLNAEVVESVNIHESIKTGKTVLGLDRDTAIANYITCIEHLGKAGVKVITYNFMPVFDWLRTDMWHPLEDGSTALYYDHGTALELEQGGPQKLIDDMLANAGSLTLPGWEPERLEHFREIAAAYEGIGHEEMYANYKYFLDAVIPTCEKYDVKLAVHPDDPAFDLFGWPRVVSSKEGVARVLELNTSKYNGLCLCLGSYSSRPGNDPVDAVKSFVDRIHFSHVRNIRFEEDGRSFSEVGHRAEEGNVDTVGIMRAYADAGFEGYIRPDHGRHLWEENTTNRPRPGYGLYDRALGIQYLLGVWDASK